MVMMMIAMMTNGGTTISCLPASPNVVKMMAMMAMMLVQIMIVMMAIACHESPSRDCSDAHVLGNDDNDMMLQSL